ncbi:hypothetical protein [Segniliparus rugosus]|uniref:Helix-turn-helix domain-containing protein n=1 Tax=Segniliparus rugosus (strain ATCC BAA-974 / DSM 45345 / CCUG 50838 / CIP 108380 / JCM 13579 / CDC 945) TaxID=679197 RepID=E5XKS1_SEGRC|nr:hypothetical protein [Segniliparus rugosus]EFV15064.2 hypothetical protein HMPREF9336_00090 [Segniliparus rugosus ATCC BAA-974]
MTQRKDGPAEPRQRGAATEPGSALDSLREELRTLRLRKGQPSLRTISHTTEWGHTTVGRALSCESIPRWDVVEAIVLRLDGDVSRARQLWMQAMEAEHQATAPANAASEAAEEPGRPRVRDDTFPALGMGFAICVFVSFVATLSFFAPRDPRTDKMATDIALSVFGGVAALAWLAVFAKRRDRRALALGLGMAGWTLWRAQGLISDDIVAIPLSPSIRDYIFLLFPLFALHGLGSEPSRRFRQKYVSAWALVAAVAAAALVSFVVESRTDLPANGVFVYALLLSTDIAMLAFALLSARAEPGWELRAAASGLGALLVADASLGALFLLPPPNPIAFLAALCYLAFTLLMSVAAGSAAS